MWAKSTIMKLLLCLLLTGSAVLGGKKTDFSGTYVMNKTKTNLGPAPEWILPRYIKVEQQKKTVVIARTGLNQQLEEQPPVADTLAFDGAAFVRKVGGNNVVSSSLNWNTDTSFEIDRKTINDMNIAVSTLKESWTLEEEGKTLVINREVVQANGKAYQTRAVFDRQ